MHAQKNIFSGGASIVRRNKRYIVWFYLLNLVLAVMGTAAFTQHARALLDHSLYADGLVHGFDLAVFVEMLSRPEFGPVQASSLPAMMLAIVFFVLTMVFLPGVLLGYASDHRISREEFYRASGRNVWRFFRLSIMFAILAGIAVGILSAIQTALVKAADATSYEALPFWVQLGCLIVIFLALTFFRIWFDLAEIDVVLMDQKAVRRSVGSGWRRMRANLGALLGSYVAISIIGIAGFAIGLWFWNVAVPSASVIGAFLVSQLILIFFLAVRFWQRATAVALYTKEPTEEAVQPQPQPVTLAPAVAPQGGGI